MRRVGVSTYPNGSTLGSASRRFGPAGERDPEGSSDVRPLPKAQWRQARSQSEPARVSRKVSGLTVGHRRFPEREWSLGASARNVLQSHARNL